MFVAVQDSCTYAGPKLCLNDHYLLRRSVYAGPPPEGGTGGIYPPHDFGKGGDIPPHQTAEQCFF